MANDLPRRLPISTRHAFALAFDLALRRDVFHSLVVPLLLHSPWLLAIALLPSSNGAERPTFVLLLWCVAALGEFVTHLVVDSMLRFRARSVFNTPPGTRPAPVTECYSLGLRRVPWLMLTEAIRNFALFIGGFFFIFPGLYIGYRLAFATEAVVLNDRDVSSAFARSFRYSDHRLERWLEMVAVSVFLVIVLIFSAAALSLAIPGPGVDTWGRILWFLIAAVMPIIQYAWTFFYLRLVEIDPRSRVIEVEPAYAGSGDEGSMVSEAGGRASHLTLVAPPRIVPAPDQEPDRFG
jgi:hypothetical protein